MRRCLLLLGMGAGLAVAAEPPPRFELPGIQLAGNQLASDSAFFVTDWDADGKLDFVLPTGSLLNFGVLLNRGSATQPTFDHVMPYDLNTTEMMPQTVEHASSWALGDLNGDGLPDLVIFDGYLRLAVNTGTVQGPNHWHLWNGNTYFPGSARMVEENARVSTGPESMYWKRDIFARQAVTVAIADWNNDGLNDLIVSRFKSESPGVVPLRHPNEQWTAWGRLAPGLGTVPAPAADAPKFPGPLAAAPERGLYVYLNQGTRSRPWFDNGVEILTAAGDSIAAPNPEVADLDGDGVPDIVSSETAYACNAFRVDWPTAAHVIGYRRVGLATVEAARPVVDRAGKPIPAGVQVRVADLQGAGAGDLLVLDPGHGIRWYPRVGKSEFGSPTVIRGKDFARFYFLYQPFIANWSGPSSRDLILHGSIDHHCKWDLRRTARYRNRTVGPGTPDYEFTGFLTYRGDPELVPKAFEEHHMAVYGSAAWAPACPDGKPRLLISVDGQVYLFTHLAEDGLTFQERQRLAIPNPGRNRFTGWQEIPVAATGGVRHVRITLVGGKGNLGSDGRGVVACEAMVNGTNVAPPGSLAQRDGATVMTLPAAVAVSHIRFQLDDGSGPVTPPYLPFYWQGTLYPFGFRAAGELFFQYKVEISADGTTWQTAADRTTTEMLRSFPCGVDWNGDGRFDLVLGVLHGTGLTPARREYRLYLNTGDNDRPVFDKFSPLCLADGAPLTLPAEGDQCSIIATDLNRDGKLDLVIGQTPTTVTYYENAGNDRFRRVKDLGDPQPIRCSSENRTFYIGDVDGDGIADLINNNAASIYMHCGLVLFKGVPGVAPSLSATTVPGGGVTLTGVVARTLDAAKPDVTGGGETLVVRSSARGPAVILLRFEALPPGQPVESAVLELTIPAWGDAIGPLTPWVTCSAFRDDWDAATVSYAQAAPGRPWAEDELISGGEFLSRMEHVEGAFAAPTIRWDVTRAVQAAQRAGRDRVSLILRRDYTGKYSIGNGYTFCGSAHPVAEWRPRLCLTVKE